MQQQKYAIKFHKNTINPPQAFLLFLASAVSALITRAMQGASNLLHTQTSTDVHSTHYKF